MNKIISLSLISALLFPLVACKEKNVTFVMAESNPADSLSAQMDEAFKTKVEELSGGTITVQLYAGAALGDDRAVIKQMLEPHSKIHLARITPPALGTYGCTQQELLSAPFVFQSRNHFWKFASSPTATALLDEPYTKHIGVKGLFFAEEGFRHFFSRTKLNGIEDFAGTKIRTAGNSVMEGIARCLHGEPTTVSFSTLFSALQTGIVDVAEQPIANYLSNGFHRIAPYMILDGHVLGVTEVVITAEAWDALSKEQQDVLLAASAYAGEYCRKMVQETEDQNRRTLQAEHAEFVEVSDVTAWQKACESVIQEAIRGNETLYAEIQALAE